jgi:hypothetical protein
MKQETTKFCLIDGGETIKVDIEGKAGELIDLLAHAMVAHPQLKGLVKRSLEKANEMSQMPGDLTDLISMMKKMMGGKK